MVEPTLDFDDYLETLAHSQDDDIWVSFPPDQPYEWVLIWPTYIVSNMGLVSFN